MSLIQNRDKGSVLARCMGNLSLPATDRNNSVMPQKSERGLSSSMKTLDQVKPSLSSGSRIIREVQEV